MCSLLVRDQRWLALVVCLFMLASTSTALAQVTFVSGDALREERRQEKLRVRSERERKIREREAERQAERMRHPLGLAAVAIPEVFLLGMGKGYVGSFAGVDAGLRVVREFEHVSLRVSSLARFARGRAASWDFESGGHDARSEQTVWGAELQAELAFRSGGFFAGPTFAAGYLHLRRDTLDERNLPNLPTTSDPPLVVQIPGNAAFVATGLALGGEGRASNGRVAGAVRLMGGPWNDMRHVYLQLSVVISVVFWDSGR